MTDQRLPPSAVWGMTIGCTAWSVMLTVFFFAYGAPASAWTIGVPCMVLSAGFVAVILLALEGVARAQGLRSPAWTKALWGLLLHVMGILLILVNAWIGPAMEAAGMTPGPVMGVTSVPSWVPITLLVAGTALLVRVCLALMRAETPSPDS